MARAAAIRTVQRRSASPEADGPRLLGCMRRPRAALLVGTALQACTMFVVALPVMAAGPAPNAQPTGGQVVTGSASIGQTTTETTITQASQRAAVNWSSFDVGSQQTVTFKQPSASAVTLNRVTGPDPSQIAGHIQANGQIVLTNQSGVVFTQGAQVDTAGLIVSAAGISDKNFMAGKMAFDQPAKAGAAVVNQGTITVRQAGLAALVAPQVANSGTINAKLGHVVLAGARAATLDLYGDGLVSIDVTRQVAEAPVGPDGKPVTALVTNSGAIVAQGGTVQLTAAAVDGVVSNLVTAGGRISAATKGSHTGTVVVDATGGSATVTGTLAAVGYAAGATGGQIQISASNGVTLAAGSRISVAGKAGGGTVALGTTLARAHGGSGIAGATTKSLTVQAGATVVADATATGDGGRIVLLSSGHTQMDGSLSAKGGKQGGNGGFVEVSGKTLGMAGQVDASAPAGAIGTILLDPDFLTIVSGSAGSGDQDPTFIVNGGTVAGTAPSIGADSISNGVINAFAGNVLLQANKALTVAGDIALTSHPGQSLTLEAGGTITVNSGIVVTASGDVILATGGAGPSGAPAAQALPLISILGSVASTGGSVSLLSGAGGIINIGAAGQLAGSGRVSIQTDSLSIATGGTVTGTLFELAPFTSGTVVTLGQSGGLLASLDGIGATTVRLGAVTQPGSASPTTLAGSIVLAGNFGTTGTALELDSQGGISQTGGALTAASLAIGAGGIVSLADANTIATLGSVSATSFALNDSGQTGNLTLGGPISAVDIAIGGAGTLTVAGLVVATGTLALASGAGGIAVQDGAWLNGGTVDLSSLGGITEGTGGTITATHLQSGSGVTGSVALAGSANAIGTLDGFVVTGGDFSLADTNGTGLTIAGPLSAANITVGTGAQPLRVTGSVAATGSLGLSGTGLTLDSGAVVTSATIALDGSSTGIVLNSGATLGAGGTQLDLTAIGGGVTEAAGATIIAASLGSVAGLNGTVDLAGTANAIGMLTSLTVTGGTFHLVDTGDLSMTGVLAAAGVQIVDGGSLTVSGSILPSGVSTAIAVGLTAGAIDITGLVNAGAAGSLSLVATAGGIAETGTILTGSLSGAAITAATLDGAGSRVNHVATLGDFTATAFSLRDGIGLTVAGDVTASGSITLLDRGTLQVTGTIAPSSGNIAVRLTATDALILSGLVSDGGGGTTSLVATGGTISQTGTLIAGTLTGSAAGDASFIGAGPTINQVATLGDFAAASFLLNDGANLAVQGTLLAGSAVTIVDSGSLRVGGTIAPLGGSPIAVGLTATTLNLPGLISDGGAGTVSLVATHGTIGQTGTLIAGTLSGSAMGAASFTGPGNAVGTLADFTAASFALTDSQDLAVTGTVTATTSVSIVDTGALLVAGTIAPSDTAAIAIGLTAASLTLPGLISDGGSGTTTLQATSGGIDQTGMLIAGTLSGGATGTANFAGAGATIDQVATLGDFAAGSFALNDGHALTVAGVLAASSSVAIVESGSLLVAGTIQPNGGGTAISVGLTGAAIGITGLVSGGSGGSVALDATAGGVVETGTLLAGTLAAQAVADIDLTGASATANRIGTLGNVAADAFTLRDGIALSVAGPVLVGSSGTIADSGTMTVGGTIAPATGSAIAVGLTADTLLLPGLVDAGGGSVALVATTGSILQTGTLLAGTLSGSAAGSATLTGAAPTTNQVDVLGTWQADTFTLNDGRSMTLAGTLAVGHAATLIDSGTLSVTGALVPTTGSSIAVALTADAIDIPGLLSDGGAGTVALTALTGDIQQTGTLIAHTLSGSAAGDASFTGAGPTIDHVATLGDFAANRFTLNDGANLAVSGTLLAAGAVTIMDSGSLRVGGTIAPLGGASIAVGLTATTLNLPGLVSDGGAGTVSLVATSGTISQTGTLIAGTLSGSAFGAASLSGAGATTDQVATLGDFSAGSFALRDGQALTVAGTLAGGSAVQILDAGTLLVAGTIAPRSGSAIAVGLTADAIAISGLVSDGGAGSTSLVASTGAISETGVLRAGTLSGSAATSIALTGATSTSNVIATLGPMTAGTDLALYTAGSLDVTGAVAAGTGHTIAFRADGLAVHGSVSAPGGQVAIAPATAGRTISLDATRGSGTLSLLQSDFDAIRTGTLTLGSVDGTDILAGAIRVNGTAMVANASASLLRLYAAGAISGSGVLGATMLTGQANTVALSGANVILDLGDFSTSGGFSLNDAAALTVGGTVNGGAAVAITDAGALRLPGSITATSVSLTGTAIDVSGGIDGTGSVSLIATQGGITAGGVIATPLLGGSAVGGIALTGANRVASLGSLSAGTSFIFNDTTDLSIGGPVSAGTQATLTDTGALSIPGSLNAPTVTLSANSIALSGALTGTNAVSLTSLGDITGAGILTTAQLTGTAAGAVSLTGPNAIATLGDFTAGAGLTLVDQANFTVASVVDGGPSVTITDAGTMTVPGSITANAIALTAQALTLGGFLNGAGSVALTATTGSIQQTGTIRAGLLSGHAATSASIAGTNAIQAFGDFTATGGLTLLNSQDPVVSGTIDGGSFVLLSEPAALSIAGSIRAQSVTITAGSLLVEGSLTGTNSLILTTTDGAIAGGGILATAHLTGSAATSVDLTGPNQVGSLVDFSAGTAFTLNNRPNLAIGGAITAGTSVTVTNAGSIGITGSVTAPNLVSLTSTGGAITETNATLQAQRLDLTTQGSITLNGGTLLTGGTVPTGRVGLDSSLLPSNGGAGVLLTAASIRQTGTLTIAGSAGGASVAELSPNGNVALASVAAPQTWLILNMQAGIATATNLTLGRLDLFYTGSGGGAALFGTIGGLSGAAAAQNAFILPLQNAAYLLNGCPIGSVDCILVQRDPVPVQKPLDTVEFTPIRVPTDDPDLFQILPNVSKLDY
ncbi:MAG: filamentous hemagglutinin N-terminal domain-containing protein [Acetobacteraceae bacterium]|nr:filamentous hemagglutinin N-terminal domain-containing protein [Acetobacteraceae bacterium]